MKKIIFLPALFCSLIAYSQTNDELTIRKVLDDQIKSWNRGDIEGFMQGYWKNDSLMFIGKTGINWDGKKRWRIIKKVIPIQLRWVSFHLISSL